MHMMHMHMYMHMACVLVRVHVDVHVRVRVRAHGTSAKFPCSAMVVRRALHVPARPAPLGRSPE